MEMSQEMETHSIKQAEKTVEKHDLDKDINHIGPIMLSIDTSRLPSKPQPVIYNFSPTRSFYESNISPRHAPEYNHSGSDYQYYHKFTANQRLDTSSHAIKYLLIFLLLLPTISIITFVAAITSIPFLTVLHPFRCRSRSNQSQASTSTFQTALNTTIRCILSVHYRILNLSPPWLIKERRSSTSSTFSHYNHSLYEEKNHEIERQSPNLSLHVRQKEDLPNNNHEMGVLGNIGVLFICIPTSIILSFWALILGVYCVLAASVGNPDGLDGRREGWELVYSTRRWWGRKMLRLRP